MLLYGFMECCLGSVLNGGGETRQAYSFMECCLESAVEGGSEACILMSVGRWC